jgi:hypothetical protein
MDLSKPFSHFSSRIMLRGKQSGVNTQKSTKTLPKWISWLGAVVGAAIVYVITALSGK